MNKLSRYITVVAFAVAGVASHANAAVEQNVCGSASCFQLTPVAKQPTHNLLVEDGASLTPQGRMLAENGASRTPQGKLLKAETA
ncbi:hypothetical protein [Pseudomonas segetis]|uniref:Uncharacterized protein n=1 Tax=Pseudomonas segetis TaxID=298908 RepID=A0A239HP32_9PSED|nr:hypothetical protein [Pseudomonas segetis]SNS82858.1 hypothetical protein SAMN05216255_3497 [Pseudomonas segetis]